ncbi:MAG: hypothetical protein QW587_04005 [Candidatus Bathyarchaeia archaeon]
MSGELFEGDKGSPLGRGLSTRHPLFPTLEGFAHCWSRERPHQGID